MTGPPGEMPFLDHLEELRWRILRSLGALVVGFGARPLAGPAVSARQSPQATDRALSHRRRRQADRHQPHRAGDDRLQARLHRRAGARLARRPLAGLGLPGAGALRAGEARARARAVRRAAAVPRRRAGSPTCSWCPRRCGCCSASRPKRFSRSSPTTPTSISSCRWSLALGHLVRAAARHHHPGLARRHRRRPSSRGSGATRWWPPSSPGRCSRRAPTSSR